MEMTFSLMTKFRHFAELDKNGDIIKVHHNHAMFVKEYRWSQTAVTSAINRNGTSFGKKFINITEEEYYKIKPVTLIR